MLTPTPAQVELLKRAISAALREITPEQTAELLALFPTPVPVADDPVDPIHIPPPLDEA